MNLSFSREQILIPLQHVIGAVEKRQTVPILANVLFREEQGALQIVATDLEIELKVQTDIPCSEPIHTTVPARKLLDISKNLPDEATIKASIKEDRVTLTSGRSRFVLASLPGSDFPALEKITAETSFEVPQKDLRSLIERTAFAMAQQDVRYYLNGLLLESKGQLLRTVATDGHRLALADAEMSDALPEGKQIIVPRKGILELQRLLEDSESPATVKISSNHISVELPNLQFTSKLIDGRFPDYERVMATGGDKLILADRQILRQSLTRTSVLSNEKYRGVQFTAESGTLRVQTQNPDKEEAEDEVEIEYTGESLTVAFNVNYLLDALNALTSEKVQLILKDEVSSCVLQDQNSELCKYVIMPMRL